MAYRNNKTGTLREERRRERRLSTSAPVGQSSVGHGSGLRFYDGGELMVDGRNAGMVMRVQDVDDTNSVSRLLFVFDSMAGVLAAPAIWSQSATKSLVLAGPRLNGSTSAPGYGGSNLFLYHDRASLVAGEGGTSRARLSLEDRGTATLQGSSGYLDLNSDGLISLRTNGGQGMYVGTSGQLFIQAINSIHLGTGEGGAAYNSHRDGSFYIGSAGNPIIQGTTGGRLNMWAPTGSQMNGDFTVAGSKNFIMDHPTKPGHTIKYAATESPVSGIEHRGRVTIGDDGTADVVFPEHFTAIVKAGTEVDVFLQAYGPDPAWCNPPTHEGTTVHGEPGTVVAWHAIAERLGADFDVVEEGTINQTPPAPDEGDQ